MSLKTYYKHTQISYLMIITTLCVAIFFVYTYILGTTEQPSVDSGNNLLMTTVMIMIVCLMTSFVSLHVTVDDVYIHIKFGYGIYQKKFLLSDIGSVKMVKNHWYDGRGIRRCWGSATWLYSIAGLDAVQIHMKDGKIYRIGSDEAQKLQEAILTVITKEVDK